MDLSIFAEPQTWITMLTLIFLEIVLGIDNLVFITITTDRLPQEKQHIGRKLGLAGALVSRIIFLSFASFLVHMTNPVFTISLPFYEHGFSVRDIVLLAGGIYLIYKGIAEVREVLSLNEIKAAEGGKEHEHLRKRINLPEAVGIIMVMDIVFSIDSVITAVGLADHLIVMIIAVMIAVFIMMAFIDPISNFINNHAEIKILALTFITVIGILLVVDALGFHSGIEVIGTPVEKMMVYFAMVFCLVIELIQMRYNKNLAAWRAEQAAKTAEVPAVSEQAVGKQAAAAQPGEQDAASEDDAAAQAASLPEGADHAAGHAPAGDPAGAAAAQAASVARGEEAPAGAGHAPTERAPEHGASGLSGEETR